MRRHTVAAAFLVVLALVAAPAAANPIAFVSGPSPVAIISGTLSVSGPDVSGGQFLLQAANGSVFSGGWVGFRQAGVASAANLPAVAAFVTTTGQGGSSFSSPGWGSSSSPVSVAPPFQFFGVLFGFDPAVQAPQLASFFNLFASQGLEALALGNGGAIGQLQALNGANVPEPGTIILLSSGLAGLALARRRRKAGR